MNLSRNIISSLENIYISPLELCNLNCKYCYTKKTKNILSNRQILSFVRRYNKQLVTRNCQLKSVIFCGGEVFTLKNFPCLVNNLISQNIFITIITNGTIDKLDKIKDPKNCQLIVSFDGPQKIHDQNRGQGNFVKSKNFVEHALKLGFPVEIFYLITKDSYLYRDSFPKFLSKALKLHSSKELNFTYLTDRLGSLTSRQVKNIRQNYPVYPSKNFGCAMLSLQSDGKFYPCCESNKAIGSLSDPLSKILLNYSTIYLKNPLCPDPDYFCNFKNEVNNFSERNHPSGIRTRA
ncbi:MAG TPA: radical SAM protein [Candidatus Woesebacteria bacterium]|nr:radical SAM protein [Candidatus Woesebacteria bacterium]HPR99458.1 radical SAM protein [Candidatus Woesebacteria bacterium]